MTDKSYDDFDISYRPVLACTVVWGLMIISMLGFLGSTLTSAPIFVTRHAVMGFRLTYLAFTIYIILLGLLYAFGSTFGPKMRLAINALSAIVFLYAFTVVGEEFGRAFIELPGIGSIDFTGSALQAVLAIVSLPMLTLALLVLVFVRRGFLRTRAQTSHGQSATQSPSEPSAKD